MRTATRWCAWPSAATAVATPLVSRLARECGVDVSILQAKVESIQGRTLGLMIAELIGNSDDTRARPSNTWKPTI